jgi:hypothetical protein
MPRGTKRKPASTPAAQVPDEEPQTKRATRNSAASAGDEWMTSNTVTIADDDSDFDDLYNAPEPEPESQVSPFSQLSQSQSQEFEVETLPTPSVTPPKPSVAPKLSVPPKPSVPPKLSVPPKPSVPQSSPVRNASIATVHKAPFSPHPDLIPDIAAAAATNGDSSVQRQNVRGAINFHLKLMLLKRRNITAAERKAFVQYVVTNTPLDNHEMASLQKHVENVRYPLVSEAILLY